MPQQISARPPRFSIPAARAERAGGVNGGGIEAELSYLSKDSRINRRYVAPGAEVNTGIYEPHRVTIRNARPMQDRFSLDANGFVLARHESAVGDFRNKAEVDGHYTSEVQALVRKLTGADLVLPLGWMLRASDEVRRDAQPPASDVHVDMTTPSAERRARTLFEHAGTGHPRFRRFIATSLWRPFSDPPHDWPLAVCDAASVDDDEGVPNLMIVADSIPERLAMAADVPNPESLPAAFVFHFSPRHRWWYFPHMTRDEVILLKLHDSDHSRAWRVPHTAFRDPSFPNARPRESIEFRTIAYFL
jgi:hypothetical protein